MRIRGGLGFRERNLAKVSHYYTEAHDYFGSRVLIVGGKNSAVSTALELWRAGVEVSICHRRPEFGPLKYWLGPDIENRVKNGEIPVYMPAEVTEILPGAVRVRRESGGVLEIENDFVLALTGYGPDPAFLGRFGIEVESETGRPAHNPKTLESNRPGLYMVGEMLSGNISGVIFIENSRIHGEAIAAHLRETRAARVSR
jgi:thioredoxin reductase (NADPH)